MSSSNLHTSFGRTILMGVVGLVGISLVVEKSAGDDWLQWRGANRADRSNETGLLQQWPEDGPKQQWLFDQAGLGYAGFSIVDGNLYTMGLEGSEEFALCIDAETGKEKWRTTIGPKYSNSWGNGPRSTPTIDGEHVYCMSASGSLACLTTADGKLVWDRKMDELGGRVPNWGYAESPLVEGDLVVCTPGGEKGSIAALNKKTGETVWQCAELTEPAHYSSIIAADINGSRQLVQLLVKKVVGVDAKAGKLLWETDWNGQTAVIPTPVFENGIVYVTSGYGAGCAAFRIGEGNQVQELYRNKVMKNHHGGAIAVDDHVYGYSDDVGWVCQNLDDGKMVWNDKKSVTKGAISYADGRFYHVQESDGQVLLIKADPSGYEEKGRFTLSPQTERRAKSGRIWVHPVISDGKLYLRDQEYIYCFDVKND